MGRGLGESNVGSTGRGGRWVRRGKGGDHDEDGGREQVLAAGVRLVKIGEIELILVDTFAKTWVVLTIFCPESCDIAMWELWFSGMF